MRNINKILNQFQVNVLMKGMREEAAKDIRLHPAMKNETASTYEAYLRGEECAYEALLYIYDFWNNYFIFNEDVAFAIHEGYQQAHTEELNKRCAEIEKKMYADMNEIEKAAYRKENDEKIAQQWQEITEMMEESRKEKAEIDEMMKNR